MLEDVLQPALEDGACPHLAVLLRTAVELPPVLASFYALGARREGWLVHRSLPGQVDPERALLAAAGLDVGGLEAEARLVVSELDPAQAPEDYGRAWEPEFQAALGRGHPAMWYSRFAVGAEIASYDAVMAFDREWEAWFRGREVVTLCPFIVGDLTAAATIERVAGLAELHDGIVLPRGGGFALLERAV